MDTFQSLMDERKAIRDTLAEWWAKWGDVYRREVGKGDPGAAVFPIDQWARETPEETSRRWPG